MTIKTFDTILTELCNYFDELISPRFITRASTNIIYLLLKAYAKGNEVINNLVVNLRNKFNPERCSEDDLLSIAKLVGTQRLSGSSSGLNITVKNNGTVPAPFPSGTYTYTLNNESVFEYFNPTDTDIPNGKNNTVSFIAMSTALKAIHVTEQPSITVTYKDKEGNPQDVSSDLKFSCQDNKALQGVPQEPVLDFRKRIIQGKSTATLFNKMEAEINNLPYIFSCRLVFNPYTVPYPEGNVSIDPYKLLVVIQGNPRDEVAEIIASYGVYETQQTEQGKYIDYKDDIFVDGYYRVFYTEPETYPFDINIHYEYDAKTISDSLVRSTLEDALQKFKLTNEYIPLLTERYFSNYIYELGIPTLQVLNVDLVHEGTTVDYIKVPKTGIARLNEINFFPES